MSEGQPVFAGSIPETYRRYLVPLIFEEYARDLAGRVKISPDGSVLEIACGTGILTQHLYAVLPRTVKIVATDLNAPMLEAARADLVRLGGLEFRKADGTALPFENGTFDVVVCQFGVMFFSDKGLGFREAARVLKPGGSFVFNVWDSLAHNRFAECVHTTVVEMSPDNPPSFLALPYGYHDPSEIRTQLQRAGFSDIHFSVLPRESRAPSARDVALAFTAGTPLAAQLAERQIEASALKAAETALIDAFGGGDVAASMQAIAIVANMNTSQ